MCELSKDQTTEMLKPRVSVIVPHYNDLSGLRRCHEALLAQTFPASNFEVIVADNNSSCGLEDVQRVAWSATVVAACEQGAGPARNVGVAISRGSVLAFLDSDCRPDPGWLAAGVASLDQFDFTGGQVVVFPQIINSPTPVEAFEMIFNFDFRRYIEVVGFTGTGNMFVRRHVFDQVGGFRSGISEDMDWSMRARRAGHRLGYVPGAIVCHPARQSWPELELRWTRLTAEHFGLACERRMGITAFLLRGMMMPLSIVPHAAKILVSPRLLSTNSRLGALAILCRLRLWRAWRALCLVKRHYLSEIPRDGDCRAGSLD